MSRLPKHNSITLSVFSLPLLIALLAITALGARTFIANKGSIQSKLANGAVLSDNDENDSDDDSSGDSNDDGDREDGKNDDSDTERDSNKSGGGSEEDYDESDDDQKSDNDENDSESELEDENNDLEDTDEDTNAEDELEDSEETAMVSTITNSNGTITKTYKKTDGDEIKTKIVVFSATGKIISKTELKEDGSEDKSETKIVSMVTNPDGTITKIFKKTEGNRVETKSLTYDQNGRLIRKAELNADGSIKEEEIINRDEDESDESTEPDNEGDDDEFELTFVSNNAGAVDPTLTKIIKAKLKQEIESEDGLGTSVNKVELEIKTAGGGALKYEGTALKAQKLFGIFGIEIPVDIVVDPITGKIVSVNESFWAKIADFFSL